MRKITAKVQEEIRSAIASMDSDQKPTIKSVSDAYRKGDGSVADAINTVTSSTAPISNKAKQSAKEQASAKAATQAEKPKVAAKVLPSAPDGWTPGASNTGFVKYARRLRSTSQPVSAYRLSAASTPDEKKLADELRKEFPQGTFVVVNHTTNAKAAFDSWADAYAYTCTMNTTNLARSVAKSIGDKGLAALASIVGTEVTVRPEQSEQTEQTSA